MNTPGRELQLATAFGPSLADAIFLAHQIDESEDDGGHRRSFVVRLGAAGAAKITETLPHPAYKSWRSSSGTAYVSSDDGELWIHDGSAWTRERVCEERVQLGPIWGFAGATAADDTVVVATHTNLYVRSAGVWHSHAIPELTEMVMRLHGLAPDELYLTTGYGLWLFDGQTMQPVEGPQRDLSGIRVVSDDEIIVTGQQLFRWTRADGWNELPSPGGDRHTIAVEIFRERVYVGSASGVLRLDAGTPTLVGDAYCNLLAEVGDHLVAGGDKTLVYDGARWRAIDLPVLARGQQP
jgi:hypothetical protein